MSAFWATWLVGGGFASASALTLGVSENAAASKVAWATSPSWLRVLVFSPLPLAAAFGLAPFFYLHSFGLSLLVAIGGGVLVFGCAFFGIRLIPNSLLVYRNRALFITTFLTGTALILISYFQTKPEY